MSDLSDVTADMAAAEFHIREAMEARSPAARCDAVLRRYWDTAEDRRDAFVAVLIARLTLVRPNPMTSDAGASA
ncbi:hypothetical protein ACN9MF_20395 [Methylobacterium fujisawaense]|uniref:hypothetical protein n=1 Tax=Methylobacterium fujisawaense TaxID=107400 RepID=UPI003CEF7E34